MLHLQLGHAIATQMKNFIREARKSTPALYGTTYKISKKRTCVLLSLPAPPPVCAIEVVPDENHTRLSTDIVYFSRKPFLHCLKNGTKWLELDLLQTRRLQDQFNVPTRIQLLHHGIPKTR